MRTIDTIQLLRPRDKDLLSNLKCVIQGFSPSADLLLYGSVARGTQYPESDYDILVLMDTPLTLSEDDAIQDAVYNLELSYGVVISIIFFTKDEWSVPLSCAMPFHKQVEADAVLL